MPMAVDFGLQVPFVPQAAVYQRTFDELVSDDEFDQAILRFQFGFCQDRNSLWVTVSDRKDNIGGPYHKELSSYVRASSLVTTSSAEIRTMALPF